MSLFKETFKPMLLGEVNKPFDDSNYLYEMKFDGYRALIYASPQKINIISRNLVDITNLFPELLIIKDMVKTKVIFDGEIICTENGYPSFTKLQQRTHLKSSNKIKAQVKNNPATFICFDILYENNNLINYPLIKRKEILSKYQDNDYFVKTKYIVKKGIKYFSEIKKMDLEGIVAKKIDSKYLINERSDNWLKIKNLKHLKLFVGGYVNKENSHVLSCYLGKYDHGLFTYYGKVFINKQQRIVKKILNAKKITTPFVNHANKDVSYILPKYQILVKYLEMTKSNHLRQPFFIKELKNEKTK